MGLVTVHKRDHAARDDDADRLRRARDGDQQAFRNLVDTHLEMVRASAMRLLGDPAEADDVAQETFVRLWRQADKLVQQPLNVGGWLRRVAVNAALDRLRAAKRLDVRDDVPETEFAADQVTDLMRSQAGEAVQLALAALPDRQRTALVLFHFEERSQREVAEMLEISQDALESLLARGRRTLKRALAHRWQELLDDLSTENH